MFIEQEVIIQIRDVTIWGEGVGTSNGLTIFVDGAIPGETVRAKIVEKKPSYAKALLIEILEPTFSRIKPICPVFGKCGGCQIMHLEYSEQLILKRKRVVDAFVRLGKLNNFTVASCIASPKPLFYRNKVQLPVDKDLKVGLYAKRTHNIIPIQSCYIQSDAGNSILQKIELIDGVRHILFRSNRKGEVIVVLVTRERPTQELKKLAKTISEMSGVIGVLHGLNPRDDNVLYSDAYTIFFGQGVIHEEVLGIKVEISPSSFFQVNLEQAENLYKKACELAAIESGDRVLDAYSGIGVFSSYLAKQGAVVTGIEMVESAVVDAKRNAKANCVSIDFQLGRVEDCIEELDDFEVIFLNPPRKGCEESVLDATIRKNPRKIIYTSCDPATLARDLNFLQNRGYSKIEAFPFDMFPQTMHVEVVVKIEKGNLV